MSREGPDPGTLVADVLTAPGEGVEHVPALLGLLDVGDSQVRLGAATALCVVATAAPDTVPSLVRRLADRADGDSELEVRLALEYLAARFPETVTAELDDIAAQADARNPFTFLDRKPTPTDTGNLDVGRTSPPGDGAATGPRSVYTRDQSISMADTDADGSDETAQESNPADETGRDDSGDGDGAGSDGETDGERRRETRRDIMETLPSGSPLSDDTEWLPFIEYESMFDTLSVLAPRDRRRYCDAYRTLGTADDAEYAVALRHLRRPTANDEGFLSALGSRLEDWQSVAGLDNVVTIYDWGLKPRLWLATEYTETTVAARDGVSLEDVAWHAEQLAAAVAKLHERGVVHGGIDPDNVVYYGNVIEEDERQPPLLDNVGLIHAYRQHANPAVYLDPRYAAPEYFDRRYGRIDHATDIYQLGAVCYLLFTGEPPYTGEFGSVRESVLDGPPPVPSDVATVPSVVDDIVRKAMARQKLARYETAAHVAQELRSLGERPEDNGG